MSSTRAITLLQVVIALIGMLWKLKEGYPLLELPDLPRLFESAQAESGYHWLDVLLEVLTGVSMKYIMNCWPWFSLHLFLYIGQLVPFIFILIRESPSDNGMSTPLRYAELFYIPRDWQLGIDSVKSFSVIGLSILVLRAFNSNAVCFVMDTPSSPRREAPRRLRTA